MAWYKFWETRSSIEDPQVPISDRNIIKFLGMQESEAGVNVNIDTALTNPSVWAAVNFISSTAAGLPIHEYLTQRNGAQKKVNSAVSKLLKGAVNDELTSFAWRKQVFEQVLTGGRSVTFIERSPNGKILNLWPLNPDKLTIEMKQGQRFYKYTEDGRKEVVYSASEVIDMYFMLKPDGLKHYSPILSNKDVIGLAIAATRYGSKFFTNGGVPPFAITGNFQTSAAMQRAAEDLEKAVRKAAKEKRQALTMPAGLDIKQIGSDPEKTQLVETKRFLVEEIARIYSLPPTFLQDLTHGTFSNTEQQDLHFVKHTLKRWVEQFEQELTLKLFGRANNTRYVELNMDGLLRGDFKNRMEGHARAIQSGVMTPNEARRKENLPDNEHGNDLMMQGATVPIKDLPNQMQLPLDKDSSDE